MTAMESPQIADLDRVRAVTANFFFWQGLRWVPMGLALILFAVAPYAKGVLGSPWTDIVTFATLFVALWLSTDVLGRYYTKVYGQVQGIPGQHAQRSKIKWFVVYPAMVVAIILDWKLNWPIFTSGIAFGAGIEAYRRSTGGGRRHYSVAAALLVLLAFAPLTGMTTNRQMLAPFIGLLGLIYVVGGVLDHFELARVLGPARAEDGSTV
jgi:hypothetical protein